MKLCWFWGIPIQTGEICRTSVVEKAGRKSGTISGKFIWVFPVKISRKISVGGLKIFFFKLLPASLEKMLEEYLDEFAKESHWTNSWAEGIPRLIARDPWRSILEETSGETFLRVIREKIVNDLYNSREKISEDLSLGSLAVSRLTLI